MNIMISLINEVKSMSKEQTMKDLQHEVDLYISQFKEGYFSPLAMLARLTEELGEFAREINHYYGEKPKKTSETEKAIDASILVEAGAGQVDVGGPVGPQPTFDRAHHVE